MLIGGIFKRLKKRSREEKRQREQHPHTHEEDLAQTPFPDFNVDAPGSDCTEISDVDSDDEEAIEVRKKQYRTKVDEDVAVFLKLAEKMSLESLLHLLAGQARTQNLQYVSKYIRKEDETDSDDSDDSDSEDESSVGGEDALSPNPVKRMCSISKTKQFRFAEVTNNQVREIIHEIDPLKDFGGELWWQENEIREIRKSAIETVRFYVRHRKDFTASVEQVFGAATQQEENPKHVKKLADESFVRGLEGHIVPVFASRRSNFRRHIVDLQDDLEEEEMKEAEVAETLSQASIKYSELTTKFALRMAQIDYLEALKSNMSRWRPESSHHKSSDEFFDC